MLCVTGNNQKESFRAETRRLVAPSGRLRLHLPLLRLDPAAALADADFDGWQGNTSQQKQSIDPAQAGGILSTILDRVESIEAKLRPPRQPTPDPAAVRRPWKSPSRLQPHLRRQLSPRNFSSAATSHRRSRRAKAARRISAPRAAGRTLAASQGEPGPVETLDIPKGWTGAAVYHAATCPHCPAVAGRVAKPRDKGRPEITCASTAAGSCWSIGTARPDLNRPAIGGLPAVLYFVDGHERVGDRVIGFGNRPGRTRRNHRQASAQSASAQPTAARTVRAAPVLSGQLRLPRGTIQPVFAMRRWLRRPDDGTFFRVARPSTRPASACSECRFSAVRLARIRRTRLRVPDVPMTYRRTLDDDEDGRFRGLTMKTSTLLFGVWLGLLTVSRHAARGRFGRAAAQARPCRLALDDASPVADASRRTFAGLAASEPGRRSHARAEGPTWRSSATA